MPTLTASEPREGPNPEVSFISSPLILAWQGRAGPWAGHASVGLGLAYGGADYRVQSFTM